MYVYIYIYIYVYTYVSTNKYIYIYIITTAQARRASTGTSSRCWRRTLANALIHLICVLCTYTVCIHMYMDIC